MPVSSMAMPNDFDFAFRDILDYEALPANFPDLLSASNTGLADDNTFEQASMQEETARNEWPATNQEMTKTTPAASGSKRKRVNSASDAEEQDCPRNKRTRDTDESSNEGSPPNFSAQARKTMSQRSQHALTAKHMPEVDGPTGSFCIEDFNQIYQSQPQPEPSPMNDFSNNFPNNVSNSSFDTNIFPPTTPTTNNGLFAQGKFDLNGIPSTAATATNGLFAEGRFGINEIPSTLPTNDFFAQGRPNHTNNCASTSATATNNLFTPGIHLDTKRAAGTALIALTGALKRNINFIAIPEPAKTHIVNQLVPIYFHNQHCAWVDAFAKANGELPHLQSYGDIEFEQDLLQQYDLLHIQHVGFAAQLPTQNRYHSAIADHAAISGVHSEMLLQWAFEWDTKPDNGIFIVGLGNGVEEAALQATQLEGVEGLGWEADAGPGLEQRSSFDQDANTSLPGIPGWVGMHSAANSTASYPVIQTQVAQPPTDSPHSTADDDAPRDAPDFFATSPPATITRNPTNAQQEISEDTARGSTEWNRNKLTVNDIFPEKPMFQRPVADESTPIETILRDFPNHTKFVGTRLKNNKEWSNDRIASILIGHGHQSIFDHLEAEVKLKRLSRWVRNRRACGTQKELQAKKKLEKQGGGDDDL